MTENKACKLIAEIGQAHDGSLGAAVKLIDLAHEAKFWAVKFQCHIAEAESSRFEKFRDEATYPQDASRFDYWKRTAFSKEEWKLIVEYANGKGIAFGVTPFCVEAMDYFKGLDIAFWKLGSANVFDIPLMQAIASDKRPIIFSTGISTLDEVKSHFQLLSASANPISVMHCVSNYPVHPEALNLGRIAILKELVGNNAEVGYSDHSGSLEVAQYALSLGVDLLEVHICLSRRAFGPDTVVSLEPDDLFALTRFNDIVGLTRNKKPKTQEFLNAEILKIRKGFIKSAYASKDLCIGHVLTPDDINWLRPVVGMTHDQYDNLRVRNVKLTLTEGVKAGAPIHIKMLEELN